MLGNIWLIDDDEIFTFLTKKLFSNMHITEGVNVFKNGQLAITQLKEMIRNHQTLPEFIFLDLMMPVMDGWGFLEEYSHFDALSKEQITLFLLSSSNSPRDTFRAKNIKEVEKFLNKPLTQEELKTILESPKGS